MDFINKDIKVVPYYSGITLDEYGVINTPYKFSSWGRTGDYVKEFGIKCILETDVFGTTPSGNGDLAYRCELSDGKRYLEQHRTTALRIIVPNDWKPDTEKSQDIILQLHGTYTPNLSIRVKGNSLHADIRAKSPNWQDKEMSKEIPFGPGQWDIVVEWLATKNNHGYFKIKINEEVLHEYNGPTMYDNEKKAGLKQQFGLYKDDWSNSAIRKESNSLGINERVYYVAAFYDYEGSYKGELKDIPNTEDCSQYFEEYENKIKMLTANLYAKEQELINLKSQLNSSILNIENELNKLK